MNDPSDPTVEDFAVKDSSGPTDKELEEARKNIRTMLTELMDLQNDLLDLQQRATRVRPTLLNFPWTRMHLTELQQEYAELSEDVKIAIQLGHTSSDFEESDRFKADLSGNAVGPLMVTEFRPVIEKHIDRIADRSQQVEATLSNRSRDITNRIVLFISLVAIIISTTSIVIQLF